MRWIHVFRKWRSTITSFQKWWYFFVKGLCIIIWSRFQVMRWRWCFSISIINTSCGLFDSTLLIHVVFLNHVHVVCMISLNEAYGIWAILSALFTQVKPGLQRTLWLKPDSSFPYLLQRDTIQHFLWPYWNTLPFTTTLLILWKK